MGSYVESKYISQLNNVDYDQEKYTTKTEGRTSTVGCLFSGVLLCVFLLGGNVSATTSMFNVSQSVEENCSDQQKIEKTVTSAQESEKLQKHFGFNTAQWAKILKVERKTIYNWKNNTATRVKAEAEARLEVLSKFSEEFNPKHKEVFSRFLFGRQVDSELLSAFMSSPLVFDKLVDAYDNVYVRLDGMAKRRVLL